MSRRYKATKTFWKSFSKLTESQKRNAKETFKVFKVNPFDPSLRPHTIKKLSAEAKTNIWSVTIESDLRAIFLQDGDCVLTLDIGTHDIYK